MLEDDKGLYFKEQFTVGTLSMSRVMIAGYMVATIQIVTLSVQ